MAVACLPAVAQQTSANPLPAVKRQVGQPLALPERELPDAYANFPFSTSVAATGGTGLYTVLLRSNLPDGLRLETGNGVAAISGVPSAWGTYTVTVSVADSAGNEVSRDYQLRVLPALLHPDSQMAVVTDTESIKTGDSDDSFHPAQVPDSETITMSDADLIFFPLVKAFAEAITVTDTIAVFGPAKPSTSEVITTTDNDVVTAKVGILPSTAPSGTYNTAYSVQFNPVGYTGTASITESGTLPAGVTLVHVLNENYVIIHGTPTVTGTFPFTLTVTDTGSGGTSVIAYSLIIGTASQTINIGTLPTPTYGGSAFSLTGDITATSGLTPSIVLNSGPVTGSGFGPYTITGAGTASFTATQTGNANYSTASPLNFNVTISPAPLIVKATNATRAFDQPNPSFGYSFGTFVNGDTSSVVSGVPQLSGTAQTLSAVSGSPYLINISRGTLAAANYNFNFSPATLTVTQAPQTITFYPLPTLTHGSTFPLSARSSSGLPVSYSVTGGSITNNILTVTASSGSLVTVTAAQAGNGNYSAATSVVWSFTAQ